MVEERDPVRDSTPIISDDQTFFDRISGRPIKCILLGNSEVGKSSIMLRFYLRYFKTESNPTVGVDFIRKTIFIAGHKIELQIWDTAGQERFNGITRSYFKGIDACILVFDLTNKESFHSISKWIGELREHGTGFQNRLLVGNKLDLAEANNSILNQMQSANQGGVTYQGEGVYSTYIPSRQVSKEQAKDFATCHNMEYSQVSAKAGTGIQGVFQLAAKKVLERWKQDPTILRGTVAQEGLDFKLERRVAERDSIKKSKGGIRKMPKCCD